MNKSNPSFEAIKYFLSKFPYAAVISDKEDHNLYVNPQFTILLGYTLEDVSTTKMWEEQAYPEEDYRKIIQDTIPEILNHFNKILEDTTPKRLQHVKCKNGTIKSIIFQDIPISEEYFITILEDISEKFQTQQSLKQTQERYQRIVHHLPIPLVISNQNQEILYVNKKFEETFGYTLKDIPNNQKWIELAYPDPKYRAQVKVEGDKHQDSSDIARERQIVCHNGEIKWAILEEIKIGQGEYLTTFRDITAQKLAEAIAEDKANEYRKIVEDASDMIILVNTERIVIEINPACEEILGYSRNEMIGHDFREFVDNQYWDRMDKMGDLKFSGHLTRTFYEIEMIKKNGEKIFVEINSRFSYKGNKVINATAIIRDISRRKREIEEQIHREKIESIGLLAGGIAHDFNNILTSILGTINLLQLNCKKQENKENSELLADLEKATFRARDLTNQLLTFSKGGVPVKKFESIKDILYDTTKFVLRGSKVKYHFEISKNLPNTQIDGIQVSQVINNLVINALQAMPNGGNLYVRAHTVKISYDDVIPLTPGEYIQIEIEDTGEGIPNDLQKHIFEPYFSTKPTGSGLGLATAYSIIKNHEGFLTFRSIEHEGTVFLILLPILKKQQISASSPKSLLPIMQIKKILFLDDDKSIHNIMQRFCDHLGINLVSVYSSKETLIQLKKSLDSNEIFDVIITDLTIPGDVGGETIVQMIKEVDSTIPVIVSSGYSTDPIIANFREYGFDGFLKKPYTIDQLKQVLTSIKQKDSNKKSLHS
ncbi:MAG: PAS domain S-box protein [Candidatus Lokiarchaeota archaeon]|nr:PAS domain S-box protein [Candidatus Harpocratesius repetitus]